MAKAPQRNIVDVKVKVTDIYVDYDLFNHKTPKQIIETMQSYVTDYPGRDLYFCFEHYGYDGGMDLTLRERRLENDAEFNARIKAETKQKERLAKTKKTKLEEERKEYERLKKKFGDK